jgi:predicted MFS family arabinose efflux permease
MARPRFRWAALFVSLLAFVAFAFSFQTAPPLIPPIIGEFGISNVEAGLLMSLVVVPGIFLSLPAGLVMGRYGVRRVGLVSLLCVVAGSLVSATAGSFVAMLMGRLILGVGGAFILTATPSIVAQWFERDELGRAMGIFSVNMPLATVIAFPSASALNQIYGWRFPLYVGSGLGVVASLAFAALIREGPLARREESVNSSRYVGNLELWKVGLVWLFFQATALSFMTWTPTLVERFRGVPKVEAGFLASLLGWAAIICVPVYGWLSDRTGRRRLFLVAGFFLTILSLIAVAFVTDAELVSSVVALGIASAMIPPIVQSLPYDIAGPSMAGVGFGVMNICGNIGVALSQPLIGYVLDSTQSYVLCMLAMIVFAAIGAVVVFSLKGK